MEIRNPFKSNEEEKLMQQQQLMGQENEVLSSGVDPRNVEDAAFLEQRSQLAEIRRWQQDRDPAYQKLFMKLAGLKESEDGKLARDEYVIKPLCSIDGAYKLVNYIEGQDVNTIMSNYSNERIMSTLRYGFGFPLVEFIQHNYQELGIEKNIGKLNYIVNLIMNTVEPVFLRALNNGERSFESSTTKNIYHKNMTDGIYKKKGIFPWS